MTFDQEAAREICVDIHSKIGDLDEDDDLHVGFGDDPELDFDSEEILLVIRAIRMLPATLDEIDRLRQGNLELKNLASEFKKLTDDANVLMAEQAKRIAELEADLYAAKNNEAAQRGYADIYEKHCFKQRSALQKLAAKYRSTNTSLKAFKSIARGLDCDLTRKAVLADKRLDVLKKLGAAKRARGKALVEERTRNLMLMAAQGKTNLLLKKIAIVAREKEFRGIARQQLEAEYPEAMK